MYHLWQVKKLKKENEDLRAVQSTQSGNSELELQLASAKKKMGEDRDKHRYVLTLWVTQLRYVWPSVQLGQFLAKLQQAEDRSRDEKQGLEEQLVKVGGDDLLYKGSKPPCMSNRSVTCCHCTKALVPCSCTVPCSAGLQDQLT